MAHVRGVAWPRERPGLQLGHAPELDRLALSLELRLDRRRQRRRHRAAGKAGEAHRRKVMLLQQAAVEQRLEMRGTGEDAIRFMLLNDPSQVRRCKCWQ